MNEEIRGWNLENNDLKKKKLLIRKKTKTEGNKNFKKSREQKRNMRKKNRWNIKLKWEQKQKKDVRMQYRKERKEK